MSNNFKNLLKRIEQLENQLKEIKQVSQVRVQIIDREEGEQLHVCSEIVFTVGNPEMTETATDYYIPAKKQFDYSEGVIKFPE